MAAAMSTVVRHQLELELLRAWEVAAAVVTTFEFDETVEEMIDEAADDPMAETPMALSLVLAGAPVSAEAAVLTPGQVIAPVASSPLAAAVVLWKSASDSTVRIRAGLQKAYCIPLARLVPGCSTGSRAGGGLRAGPWRNTTSAQREER